MEPNHTPHPEVLAALAASLEGRDVVFPSHSYSGSCGLKRMLKASRPVIRGARHFPLFRPLHEGAPARLLALVAACLVLTTAAGSAEPVPGLYTATVFVTGQGEETRGPGIAKALAAVLVKVSGDPRLAADLKVASLAMKAADLIDAFSYRDRMEGIPVHDEQGSRDRPYDLTVAFAPAAIDAALRSLGSAAWAGPRPELLVVVAVENGDTRFALAADGAKGRDMRDAMAAAAEQFGMPVALPTDAALAQAGMTATAPDGADQALLDALARASGADIAVSGTLTWSNSALGWDADWRMTVDGIPYRWRAHRVSFDDAFRAAIGGAAQIVSGHGAPN